MTGIPGWGSAGFCMMQPNVLRGERITYVRYWIKKLAEDLSKIKA